MRVEPVIHVDLDHPRVAGGQGELIFMAHGGNSPYLEHIINVLRGINDGVQAGKAMFAALGAGPDPAAHLDVRFDDNHAVNLTGLHGIDRERLGRAGRGRPARAAPRWLAGGRLPVLASLHNMRRLIAEKQRRLREQEGEQGKAA